MKTIFLRFVFTDTTALQCFAGQNPMHISIFIITTGVEIFASRFYGGKAKGHNSVGTNKLLYKRRTGNVPIRRKTAYHAQVAAAPNRFKHGKKQQHTF